MTQVTLPAVRPDLDRLVDVALETAGETQRFDFKECLILTNDEHKLRLVKAAGAFTNTEEGGFILVGISDQREVVGLDDDVADAFEQTKLHQLLAQFLAPVPGIQVRQHRRDGKRLVVVEVDPFVEVPSVVRQTANFGKEKVVAGSFLFRTKGAQSGVLVVEGDVRALCDAIVRRRASAFLDLIRRGGIGQVIAGPSNEFAALDELRATADEEWSSAAGAPPYLEVAFAPQHSLNLTGKGLEEAVRASSVNIRHGFPFLHVETYQVEGSVSWGWYGRIPFANWGASSETPSYMWAAARTGAFVAREGFWEDRAGSAIHGGAGVYHVIGQTILMLRFCEAFLTRVEAAPATFLRLAIRASNVQGRFLEDENQSFREDLLWPGTRRHGSSMASQLSLRSTLVVAIPSSEGIVLGADSRVTAGGAFVDGDVKLHVIKGPPCLVYCITGTCEFREAPPVGASVAEALPHLGVLFDGAVVVRSILESRLTQNLTNAEAERVGRALAEALDAYICSDRALVASFKGKGVCRLCLFQVGDDEGAAIASVEIVADADGSIVLGPVYRESFARNDLCDAKFAGEYDFVVKHVLAGPGRRFLSAPSSALLSSMPVPVKDIGVLAAATLATELILAASAMATLVPSQTGIGGPIQMLLLKRDTAVEPPLFSASISPR